MDIRRLNTDKDYGDWDESHYDYWKMFKDPQDLTANEIYLARKYLDMMGLELDKSHVVTFRAAPVHFAQVIVNFIRRLKSGNLEKSGQNFFGNIVPDN